MKLFKQRDFLLAAVVSLAIHATLLGMNTNYNDDFDPNGSPKQVNIKLGRSGDSFDSSKSDGRNGSANANNITTKAIQQQDSLVPSINETADSDSNSNSKTSQQDIANKNNNLSSAAGQQQTSHNYQKAVAATTTSSIESMTGFEYGFSNDSQKAAINNYGQLIAAWIRSFSKDPDPAKALGLSGVGKVYFEVDRKGNIITARIDKSTGNPILDQAILNLVLQSTPVVAAPKTIASDKSVLAFKIDITMEL